MNFTEFLAKMSAEPDYFIQVVTKGKEMLMQDGVTASPEEQDGIETFAFKARMYLGDQMNLLRAGSGMHGWGVDGCCGNGSCTCNAAC